MIQVMCVHCSEVILKKEFSSHKCFSSRGAGGRTHADSVNHPAHYTSHPSGVECIQVAEHFGFCLGNAIKYIWRADSKGNDIEDLRKARWYLDREIRRRAGEEVTK